MPSGNELFEFNATSGDSLHEAGNPFLRGHAPKELWGLSCNPSAPEFCTIGEDRQLRIWDIYTKRYATKIVSVGRNAYCWVKSGKCTVFRVLLIRVYRLRRVKDASLLRFSGGPSRQLQAVYLRIAPVGQPHVFEKDDPILSWFARGLIHPLVS